MGASEYRWFGDQKQHFPMASGGATDQGVGLSFDRQKTVLGYYQVTEQLIQQYGLPVRILADK